MNKKLIKKLRDGKIMLRTDGHTQLAKKVLNKAFPDRPFTGESECYWVESDGVCYNGFLPENYLELSIVPVVKFLKSKKKKRKSKFDNEFAKVLLKAMEFVEHVKSIEAARKAKPMGTVPGGLNLKFYDEFHRKICQSLEHLKDNLKDGLIVIKDGVIVSERISSYDSFHKAISVHETELQDRLNEIKRNSSPLLK